MTPYPSRPCGRFEPAVAATAFCVAALAGNAASATTVSSQRTFIFSNGGEFEAGAPKSRGVIPIEAFDPEIYGSVLGIYLSISGQYTLQWFAPALPKNTTIVAGLTLTQTPTSFGLPATSQNIGILGFTTDSPSAAGPQRPITSNFVLPYPNNYGNINNVGGPLAYSVAPYTNGGITGTWTMSGAATYIAIYSSKTTREYLIDAAGRSAGRGGDLARANYAYGDVAEMRKLDAGTSSTNLEMRDAEYYLRGYAGGLSNRFNAPIDFSSWTSIKNDVGNDGGPLSLSIYNAVKVIGNATGINTAGPGELPNTRPGGFVPNLKGFLGGLRGIPLDSAVDSFTAGVSILPSEDPRLSSLPYASINSATGAVDLFAFDKVPQGKMVYIDPLAGRTMAYGFDGNRVTSLVINFGYPGRFEIYFGNHHSSITSFETFSFLDFMSEGVDGFVIEGLGVYGERSAPVILGLTFASDSPVLISAISGDFDGIGNGRVAAVPEPSTALILVVGLGLLTRRFAVAVRSG